jgi:FixJ family two-component response regulator
MLLESEQGEELPTNVAVVSVVDCDEAARTGLQQVLESVGVKVVLFHSALEFLKTPPATTSCLVLELRLPVMSGLQLQEELAKSGVQIPIIFISEHGNIALAVKAMKAGAVDFLTKPVNEQDLLDAVFAALEQDRVRRAQKASLSALSERFDSLSAREREVLFRVAAGRLNKQIAGELGISEVMVKVHRSKGMRKLHASSVADLVRMGALQSARRDSHGNWYA